MLISLNEDQKRMEDKPAAYLPVFCVSCVSRRSSASVIPSKTDRRTNPVVRKLLIVLCEVFVADANASSEMR